MWLMGSIIFLVSFFITLIIVIRNELFHFHNLRIGKIVIMRKHELEFLCDECNKAKTGRVFVPMDYGTARGGDVWLCVKCYFKWYWRKWKK